MYRTRLFSAALTAATLALPLLAHAQALQRLVDTATRVINFALGILIGVAIIAFFWGLVRYLWSASGGPEQTKASMLMVWGLLSIFFMLSIYGLVHMLQVTFGVDGSAPLNAPALGESATVSCTKITETFACLAQWATRLFGVGTALLVGGALAVYFWGIASSMFGYSAGGSAAAIKRLRVTILWGLLAIFVMFSIWGIVRILGLTLFGTNNFNSLL